MPHVFESAVALIKSPEALRLHRGGWRFLCVSKAVLTTTPQIALITLNPGGTEDTLHSAAESCEHGCAYLAEEWSGNEAGHHPLQLQVQALFKEIHQRLLPEQSANALMNQSLIGYFVPYRTPSAQRSESKNMEGLTDEDYKIGEQLWGPIFRLHAPRLVFTIDRETFKRLEKILFANGGSKKLPPISTGWGNIKAEIAEGFGPNGPLRLVRLPHLSRFKIFNRVNKPEAVHLVEQMMDIICHGLAHTKISTA